jgi:ParB-like chromosome segregation protein Spo0J
VSKSGSGSVGKLEQVPTSDLIPYARNARTHSDAQVAQIAGSIQEFGFCNPVLIDKANGIIAGHGRVRAADLLKLQTVPCIRLDHLSDAQKRAYILADNRIALSSGWDEAMLANELQDLHADEIDLGLTGFDVSELDALLIGAMANAEVDHDGDDHDEEKPNADVVPVSLLLSVNQELVFRKAVAAAKQINREHTTAEAVVTIMEAWLNGQGK